MRIKEVYVEAKRTHNYQGYTVGLTADVDADRLDEEVAELQARARNYCLKQISIDRGGQQ